MVSVSYVAPVKIPAIAHEDDTAKGFTILLPGTVQ